MQQFHGYSTRTGPEIADGWKQFLLLPVTAPLMTATASLLLLENSFSAQVVFVVVLQTVRYQRTER
jgi:hypothetical protein